MDASSTIHIVVKKIYEMKAISLVSHDVEIVALLLYLEMPPCKCVKYNL